jgi:hypothetical protein
MRRKSIPLFLLLVLILLVSCNLPSERTPTSDGADALRTVAARTVDAMATELATGPTSTSQAATLTPGAAATLTPGVSASATPEQATLTPATQVPCDQGDYVRDVNIPDGTLFLPGTPFVKTWQIKNSGSCTWDTGYSIVFNNEGDLMGGSITQPVLSEGTVAPGETVNVSISLVAPAKTGSYKGYWKLRNGTGDVFFSAKGVWAAIKVVNFGSRFVLTDNICNATWRNSSDLTAPTLPCPGKDGDAKGTVYRVESPRFYNNYEDNESAIQLAPQQVNDGLIVGAFPPVLVPDKGQFRTVVGCAVKMDKCEAQVTITAQALDGSEVTLKDFTQHAADDLTVVAIDLGPAGFIGKSTIFRIYVRANGSPTQDRVLFLGPLITLLP